MADSCQFNEVNIGGKSYPIYELEAGWYEGIRIVPVYGNPQHTDNQFSKSEKGTVQPLPCYGNRNSIFISKPVLDRVKYMDSLLDVLSNGKISVGIWDAYRPHEAAQEMDRRCDAGFVDLPGGSSCPSYVSDISAGKISGHTKGATVDIGIVSNETGESLHEIPFDFFGPEAGLVPSSELRSRVARFIASGPVVDPELKSWFSSLGSKEQLYFVAFVSGMKTYYASGTENPVEYWHFTLTDAASVYAPSQIRQVARGETAKVEAPARAQEGSLVDQKIREAISVLDSRHPLDWMRNPFLVLALTYSESYLSGPYIKKDADDGHLDKKVLYAVLQKMGSQRIDYRDRFLTALREKYSTAVSINSERKPLPSGDIPEEARGDYSKNHTDALDIFAYERTLVFAMSGGIVLVAEGGWENVSSNPDNELSTSSYKGGNVVIIYDPVRDEIFRYAHLLNTQVKVGDVVQAGQQIGRVGRTGMNAGRAGSDSHLHLEIRRRGSRGEWVNFDTHEIIGRVDATE